MANDDVREVPVLAGALLLGIVQGLTEFLPVSSSGHLVLFQQFLHVPGDHLVFDLVLHLGTLVPVLWFYRSDVLGALRGPFAEEGPFLSRPGVKIWALVVAGSVPTAIIGLTFEDFFEALFANPAALTVTFTITGLLMWSTRYLVSGTVGLAEMTWKHAVLIGLAQGCAITPGISRSGSTIVAGLALGLQREMAARFSFLLSVPAICGAVILKAKDVDPAAIDPVAMGLGFGVSMVVGYLALALLVRIIAGGQLWRFAFWAWGAAILAGVVTFAG